MAKFITIQTEEGIKYINIEQIASVEDINKTTIITLSVKKNKDENIRFKALTNYLFVVDMINNAQLLTTPSQ